MYQWLDRAPKGRNERGLWWRRHDRVRQRVTRAEGCATDLQRRPVFAMLRKAQKMN